MFDLTGKTALITGATGGLGGTIAKALQRQGATVALSGTRREVLDKIAAEIGERVHVLPCNLADKNEVEALVPKAEETMGQLDILVANAGITRDNLFVQLKDEDWDQVIELSPPNEQANHRASRAITLHLNGQVDDAVAEIAELTKSENWSTATFRLARAAVRGMMRRRFGRVIGITSVVGVTGNPGQGNYAASKAGMIGMFKSVAAEYARRGVTANCVAPGFISTPMTDKLNEKQREAILGRVPAGRLGTSEDVAAAVVYLASNEANYMTGQTLHVNGGMAMI